MRFNEGAGLDTSDVDENLLAAGVVDGAEYGIPIGANTLALYYNKEILDAAGVDPATITDWASLTAREYALAVELFGHVGEVLSRSHLLRAVWGSSFEGDPNVLDVYIGYLRGKIDKGFDRPLIHTVRGVGFQMADRREGNA